MASEIRVDKINSLSGVGTVTLSPTGVDIAGITTSTSFSGNLSGNATSADTVDIGTANANQNYYPVFTETNGSAKTVNIDGGNNLTYNPGTDTLTAGTISGAISGTTGTFTGDISVTDSTGEISVTSNGGSSNAAKINVTGASGGNAEIHLSADAAANAADNVVIKQQNGGPLKVNTNNDSVEALTITSDGNIGINQGSPNYKLHVTGTTSAARIACNDSSSGISALAVTNEANSDLESVIFTSRSSLGSSVNIPISFHTNGKTNEKIRMHTTGELSVPSGVTLGLTAADKTASNTLDDYEEGDYTVTIKGQTNNTFYTLNSGINQLSYIKIGRLVHIFGRVRIDAHNGANGTPVVSLPFSVGDYVDQSSLGHMNVTYHGWDIPNDGSGPMSMEFTNNSSGAYLVYMRDNTSWTGLNNLTTNMGNLYLGFGGCYIASS